MPAGCRRARCSSASSPKSAACSTPEARPARAMGETIDVAVAEVRDEALDIKSFRLERVDGGVLPAFTPGSHVDVHLGEGLVRQYSLCSPHADTSSYRIAVKK